MSDVNPFGDFEEDFKNVDKADPAAAPGRVPPETYKFVLTAQDVKGDGVLVDHETFATPSGTKGFKLFCEILEPESVPNPTTGEPQITKGAVLEHVFWVTLKNLPYVKRDLSTILGRDLAAMGEVVAITWAGRTFEGVVNDEKYNGFTRSRIAFINPWAPEAEAGANKHGVATSGAKKDAAAGKTGGATKAATGPAKTAAVPAKTGGGKVDF